MQSCALFFPWYCVLDVLAFQFHKLFLYIYFLALFRNLIKSVRGDVCRAQYTTTAAHGAGSKLVKFSRVSASWIL